MISSFLLSGNINFSELATDLKDVGFVFIPAFLIISTVWENLTSMDFDGLLKRLVFAILLSAAGPHVLESGVKTSLNVSDELISKYAADSIILAPLNSEAKAKKKVAEENKSRDFSKMVPIKTGATHDGVSGSSAWSALGGMFSGLLSDGWAKFMYLLAYAALWFIGIFYTLIYSVLLILIPFLSAISIFPATKKAMEGVISAITWCILTPLICTLVLCVLHQMSIVKTTGTDVPVVSTLEYLLQYLCMVVLVLYAPMMATGIIGGKGIHHIGEGFANAAATASLTVGKGLIFKAGAKGISAGWGLSKLAGSDGLRMGFGAGRGILKDSYNFAKSFRRGSPGKNNFNEDSSGFNPGFGPGPFSPTSGNTGFNRNFDNEWNFRTGSGGGSGRLEREALNMDYNPISKKFEYKSKNNENERNTYGANNPQSAMQKKGLLQGPANESPVAKSRNQKNSKDLSSTKKSGDNKPSKTVSSNRADSTSGKFKKWMFTAGDHLKIKDRRSFKINKNKKQNEYIQKGDLA